MNLFALDNAPSAHSVREEGASLPDWYIRKVCGDPKSGADAIKQARYSAHDLENDREQTREAELAQAREDLRSLESFT